MRSFLLSEEIKKILIPVAIITNRTYENKYDTTKLLFTDAMMSKTPEKELILYNTMSAAL